MKKDNWKETFSDAMNEVAEQLIEESDTSEKLQRAETFIKKKHKTMIILSGIAAAVVLIAGGFLINRLREPVKKPEVIESTGETTGAPDSVPEPKSAPERLASPEYPVTAKMMSSDDLMDLELVEAVNQDLRKRNAAASELTRMDQSLYREVIRQMIAKAEDTNPLCSPANMYLSLATLYECTEGESRAQILKALGASGDEEVRKFAKNLMLSNYVDNGISSGHMADSVWMNSGYKYHESVLHLLADDYFASVYQGTMGDPDYDKALQKWVNEETGAFLEDQVSEMKMEPGSALILLSTLYLHSTWALPFDPAATEKGNFYGSQETCEVDFMHRDVQAPCYSGSGFSAVPLMLGQNEYTMWFLLPDKGMDVRQLAENEEALSILMNSSDPAFDKERQGKTIAGMVHLSIPKFDLSAKNDLTEPIKALGITDVFLPEKADFTSLMDTEDPVFLSKAENGLRVGIDETGVTAASYIELRLDGADFASEDVDFNLDRPFLFSIQGPSGTPLIIGAVEQL